MDKKIFKWSIVISLLTAYMLPSTSSDGFAFEHGYPFKFFTTYNSPMNIGDTIFYSTAFDLFGLAMNIVVIYYIIYVFNKLINKIVTR
ncbi:hypothetical protein [Paraclostridium bifermentans]|uniref:hypothetical protein n=1 Tax=Paraclostridium bifermentans TaxID=1490 RepID=UPI0018AAC4FB|nr:hypothetical protein [Paraclostridium bifermentans]